MGGKGEVFKGRYILLIKDIQFLRAVYRQYHFGSGLQSCPQINIQNFASWINLALQTPR